MATSLQTPENPPETLPPLSDIDLARQFLAREVTKTDKDLEYNSTSTKFERNYNPHSPGRPPAEGPGSADYSDWEISRLEWLEYDKEENLAHLEQEREVLYDRKSELTELKANLDSGDPETILQLARAEKQRIEAEARRKREDKERHEGIEFEGVEEVKNLINELTDLVNRDALTKIPNSITKNGWAKYYSPSHGSYFARNEGSGKFGQYDLRLSYSRNPEFGYAKGSELKITVDDLTGMETTESPRGHIVTKKFGKGIRFEIKGNRVYGHTLSQLYPVHQFEDHGDIEIRVKSDEFRVMTQDDFNHARQILSSLVEDIKASP